MMELNRVELKSRNKSHAYFLFPLGVLELLLKIFGFSQRGGPFFNPCPPPYVIILPADLPESWCVGVFRGGLSIYPRENESKKFP